MQKRRAITDLNAPNGSRDIPLQSQEFGQDGHRHFARPAEPVRPLRPWSDQTSCYLWSTPCIFKVLVGSVVVSLRFFSNGRTNLVLPPPPLFCRFSASFSIIDNEKMKVQYLRSLLFALFETLQAVRAWQRNSASFQILLLWQPESKLLSIIEKKRSIV